MSRNFTLGGVEERIVNVLSMREHFEKMKMSLREALEFNHVVMEWVLAQPEGVATRIASMVEATKENVSLLDDLWAMCGEHGIELTEAEKIALYQDFLDD